MTPEEKLHKETKETELKEIFVKEPDIAKAMKLAYNLAVSDCCKTAKIECIADHMSMGYAARNFAVDTKTILKNKIQD